MMCVWPDHASHRSLPPTVTVTVTVSLKKVKVVDLDDFHIRGKPFDRQKRLLSHGLELLVSTPGVLVIIF
jgi:hypothetical protein